MATKKLPIWYKNGNEFKQITYEDTDTVFTYNKLAPYPVGTIYFSYTNTSPATLFGGTWVVLSTGRVIRAAQGTGTGGADTHTLTTAQMPSHKHDAHLLALHPGWDYGGESSYYFTVHTPSSTNNQYLENTGGGASSQQLARLSKRIRLETYCIIGGGHNDY